MTGILLTFDPTRGVQNQQVQEKEAYALARTFAAERFPAMKTREDIVLYSWWLTEDKDDGLPFFTPSPWPIAVYYPNKMLPLAYPYGVPKWQAWVVMKENKFRMCAFDDREALNSFIVSADLSGCRIDESAYGGITITWYPLTLKGGESIVVGYGFRFLPE